MKLEVINKSNLSPKITKWKIQSPLKFELENTIFGFDPGTTNLGIAYIFNYAPDVAFLFQIKQKRDKDAIERMKNVYSLLSTTCLGFSTFNQAVIEGASYGDTYRQVELAEIRTAISFWCFNHNVEPKILPPKKIRKIVFGNGNTQANEEWQGLPKDCTDALACAYAAFLLK